MADQYFDDEDDLSKLDRGDTFEDDSEEDEVEEEVEEEIEEEVEEEDEEEIEEEEEVVKPSKIKVPKSRLDEVIRQREDAKERNLWLEAQLEKLIAKQVEAEAVKAPVVPEVTYNFDEAEEKYISLVIEGEVDKAKRLRTEIDSHRKQELLNLVKGIQDTAATNATKASAQAIDEERFRNAIEAAKSTYSFLDDEHKSYNEEAVDTINTLLAGYVAAGKSKSEALALAVKKVAPMYAKPIESTKKTLGNQKTAEATKKAVKAANSQPPKNNGSKVASKDISKFDINKASEKDFEKLTEKEKSILRGD